MIAFNLKTVVSIHLILALLIHLSNAFFFTENTEEYNELNNPDDLILQPTITKDDIATQVIPTSSPAIVTTATIIVPPQPSSSPSSSSLKEENVSADNATLLLHEKEQHQQQEESPSTTTTMTVDPSAAIYKKALTIAPRVTGPLSIFGSILIAIEVLRKDRSKRTTYHRILLVMSIIDINTSIWYSLSSLPIPGNVVNNPPFCTAQGWALQMSIAFPIYNTMLAAFYLLVIRYKWKQDKLKKAEILFHGLPLCVSIGTSLSGIGLQIYGNANLWCWIKGDEHFYRLAFFYGPLFGTIFVTMLLMLSTVQYVVSVERKARNFRASTTGTSYSRRVATQAFCYLAVYFITWAPLVTVRIIQFADGTTPQWLLLLAALFTPFQGFLNCLVYFRPRYLNQRKNHPQMNCCNSICKFFRFKAQTRSTPSKNQSVIGV